MLWKASSVTEARFSARRRGSEFGSTSPQLVEQRRGLLPGRRVEAFGEPIVDQRENLTGSAAFAVPEAHGVDGVAQLKTVGNTIIYQSVNHGLNIRPTVRCVWYTLVALGRAVAWQLLSSRSSLEVSHDHTSSLAKVV